MTHKVSVYISITLVVALLAVYVNKEELEKYINKMRYTAKCKRGNKMFNGNCIETKGFKKTSIKDLFYPVSEKSVVDSSVKVGAISHVKGSVNVSNNYNINIPVKQKIVGTNPMNKLLQKSIKEINKHLIKSKKMNTESIFDRELTNFIKVNEELLKTIIANDNNNTSSIQELKVFLNLLTETLVDVNLRIAGLNLMLLDETCVNRLSVLEFVNILRTTSRIIQENLYDIVIKMNVKK